VKGFQYQKLALVLIVAGILSRIIPHMPNFTAVGATALFAGSILMPRMLAFLLPIIILWVSDLLLNNFLYKNMYPEAYTGWVWMGSTWVYLSFLAITFIGQVFIKRVQFLPILTASITASVLFFLVTNFGVWLHNPIWSQDFNGFSQCLLIALPFFWNTLAGDLIFSGVLFGSYYLISQRLTSVPEKI
jgi:hypothetical protein